MPGKFDSLSKLVRMSPELVEKQRMLFDKIRNSVRGSKTDPNLWMNVSDGMLDKMAKSGEIHPGLVDEIKQFKADKQSSLNNIDPRFKNSDDILSLNGDSKFKTLGNVLYNKAGNQLSKQIPLITDSAKETLGKAGEVLSDAADKVDQYVFNPARAAVSGALEGKNPLKSAYENKPTSGSDIVEKSGIAKFMNPNPVSALESEEAYKRGEELSEKGQEMTKDVLGQGVEMAIDPTMGISPAMKFGKVLKYLK